MTDDELTRVLACATQPLVATLRCWERGLLPTLRLAGMLQPLPEYRAELVEAEVLREILRIGTAWAQRSPGEIADLRAALTDETAAARALRGALYEVEGDGRQAATQFRLVAEGAMGEA